MSQFCDLITILEIKCSNANGNWRFNWLQNIERKKPKWLCLVIKCKQNNKFHNLNKQMKKKKHN